MTNSPSVEATPPSSLPRYTGAILRLEGAIVALAAGFGFQALDGSWLWFAVLFLAPDLSMLGYLRGNRVGAAIYNAAHTYLAPATLAAWGVTGGSVPALHVAALWTAHIGADRLCGYGLKEPTGFKHTHLQRV